jgi:hypothetical protein
MERKIQEHKQELERLRQATMLDKGRLIHDARLKNEAAGVSGVRTNMILTSYSLVPLEPGYEAKPHVYNGRVWYSSAAINTGSKSDMNECERPLISKLNAVCNCQYF